MTSHLPLPLSSLLNHIGQQLDYGGRECIVLDVLEDGPQFVLQVIGQRSIQPDQWGDAHRRTPESFSVVVYESDGVSINPLLAELDLTAP